MRKSESIEDTARVLSRYVDAVVIRTFAKKDVEDLARAASVPVINALTDDDHPCQALTDVFTFRERFPDAAGLKITYLGDGNNVAASLAEACAMAGIDFCLSVPAGCDLPEAKMASIAALSQDCGTNFWVERDPQTAVQGRIRPLHGRLDQHGAERRSREGGLVARVSDRRAAAGAGPARRHRDALPAGPPGSGDNRRGHGRSAIGRVRSGREPPARPEGAHGVPPRQAR